MLQRRYPWPPAATVPRVLLASWAMLALFLSGCAVQWVAEYDEATEERLIATYERVNRFYDSLADTAPAERGYDKFVKGWTDIATDLRVVALRQKARPGNAESQQIIDRLVENWEQTRARHKQRSREPEHRSNPYPDSLIALDRSQLEAQFAAAVVAEVSKR